MQVMTDNIFALYFLTGNPFCDKFILAGVFIMSGALASRERIYKRRFLLWQRILLALAVL